jgi:hypothetical protein
MLPASAAPADVTMDIGNQPRAPLQEQGTTQVAGLQVPGVETIHEAAGLNKPVRSRSPVASPVSLAPRACADNSSTAAVRFTGARTCLRPLATAFLRLPTRRAPTIPPRLLKPLNPCLVG